jgi:hypothetical protein
MKDLTMKKIRAEFLYINNYVGNIVKYTDAKLQLCSFSDWQEIG